MRRAAGSAGKDAPDRRLHHRHHKESTKSGPPPQKVGEEMRCKKSDCFSCPYPDCINDYVKPIRRPSAESARRKNEKRSALIAERRASGVCTSCGGKITDTRFRMCAACREKARRYKEQELRKKGVKPRELLDGVTLCQKCGKFPPREPFSLCERCYKSSIEHLAKTPTHNGKKPDTFFARFNEVFYADQKQAARP